MLDHPASLVAPQLVAIQPTEVRHSTHIHFHPYSQVPVVLYFLLFFSLSDGQAPMAMLVYKCFLAGISESVRLLKVQWCLK